MAVQLHTHLFGMQGNMSFDQKFPPDIMAMQPPSTRRLCGTKMHKSMEDRFQSIRHDQHKRLRPIFGKDGPHLTEVALNEEQRPVSNCVDASTNFYHSPRQGTVRELPLASSISILKSRQQQGFRIDSYRLVDVLKRCSEQKDLQAARQVHDLIIIQSGMEKDRYVIPTLINVYIKCGRLQDARRLFDRLQRTNRTVITWNVMIGAYAKRGCGIEANELFHQMQREGFTPDAITYMSILTASASSGALEWVREVHALARKAGLESHLRLGSALVRTYAKSGSIDDARFVFDGMEKRDVVTWNIMIGAYAESGCGMEAYRLFHQMKREGFIPDAVSYTSILNPSASTGALVWVKDIHGNARKAELESELRVGTALVHMYAKSGSIKEARLVFDRVEKRDVVTWNIMIGAYAEKGFGMEAYQLFLEMKHEGCTPNAMTYRNILNPSASPGALEWVKEVHGHAQKAGLESDLRVGNALVHMYANSGSIDDARLVFDRMVKRDVITWTVMIGAYAESGCGMEAYGLFLQMQREGVIPDAFTYVSILNPSASSGALEWVKDVHGHVCKAELELDLRVGTALVHMYTKCGTVDDAQVIFDRMKKRDVITWNIMIGAYAERGRGMEAYQLLHQMKQEGCIPDAFTYASILNPSTSPGALEWVKDVHCCARKAGVESDLRVGNALVRMYSKSGSINDARLVFDKMEKRDAVSWNIMIGGLALYGCGDEALKFFKEMIADCVKPDETTFVSILSACSHAGLVDDGRRIFSAMKQGYGIEPTVVHYNCMVDILGRAGRLVEAKLLIDSMPLKPNAVTWRALLGACRTSSNVELGEFAAKQVLNLEPKDAAAYVLLSNIYATAGKWEKVSSVRTMMQERGVRKEPGRSWIEVDNKTHEFLVGDTSHPEAKAIYSELNKLDEQLKATGYVPDTKVVLFNIDEEEKELALCSHSEKLAIAYGLMRVPSGKPIRVEKNLRVCSDCHAATKLISKVTEREIIVRDANRFHHFKDGVCSCGDYW